MATASMTKESVELLQQYSIDLKDFAKARVRYNTVLQKELVPAEGEDGNKDVLTATKEAQDHLKEAWQEYLASAQQYFSRSVQSILPEILEKSDSMLSPSGSSQDKGRLLSTTTNEGTPAAGSGAIPCMSSAIFGAGAAGHHNSPKLSQHGAPGGGAQTSNAGDGHAASATLQTRAERISDFCHLCDRWYVNNELTFELLYPEELTGLVATLMSSASRLMRLLGMRVTYVCAGSSTFLRRLLDRADTIRWIALCGDREFDAEVDAFLSLLERMVALRRLDAKAYPRIPCGWLYRLASFIDPTESLFSGTQKRRSRAIRLVLQLLQAQTDQAAAIGLHTLLMSACLAKGGATPEEMQKTISTILELFDSPATRQYLRTSDLLVLFAPFLTTASPCNTPEALAVLNNANEMLCLVLSTWVGILWASCETTGLRSLIDALHLPGDLDKKMVILSLFNKLVVRLAPHRGLALTETWVGFDEDRRRRTAAAASGPKTESSGFHFTDGDASISTPAIIGTNLSYDHLLMDTDGEVALLEDFIPTTKALGYHVLDPLLGRVLISLNYHGLPYALTQLMQNMGKNRVLVGAASNLLQDIFVLMDTVLPQVIVFDLHEAFNRAVGRLAHDGSLFVGGLTSQLFRNYKSGDGDGAVGPVEAVVGQSNTQLPLLSPSTPGTLDVDDLTFNTMLRDAKVDTTTSCRTWNFDILVALVQGPLHLPRRFRVAKDLIESLVLFYTPSRDASGLTMSNFCLVPPETVPLQMCVLGIELIDLLLSIREGAALLDRMNFVGAVTNMLKEVRIGKPVVLNRSVVNTCVGQSLLRMTGRLSGHANGLLLMRDHGVFTLIDSLFSRLQGPRLLSPTEEDTLHDVCYQLLQNLYLGAVPHYGVCDEVRHTFRAALANPSNSIRLCAAQQLKKAVWRDLSTSMKWGIETLLQALHDDFFSVIESAFKLLLSICLCSDEGLDYLITCFPTVLMESEVILSHAKQLRLDVLLYRIASRPSGFRFLQCYGWVEQELHRWEETESIQYVLLLDRLQNGVLSSSGNSSTISPTPFARSASGDHGRWHSRSYSDSTLQGPTGIHPKLSSGGTYLPLLTAEAASGANFFPVHFASVLCSSVEGCAMFKHSRLWTRSVQRLLEQPLPPDFVYDDTISEESGASDDADSSDDGDLNMATDATRYAQQQLQRHQQQQQQTSGLPPAVVAAAGLAGLAGGAAMSITNATALGNSIGFIGYAEAVELVGNSVGAAARHGGGGASLAFGQGAAVLNPALGGGANPLNNHLIGTAAATGLAPAVASAKEMELLKKGHLTTPSSTIISAARGYKPSGHTFSLDCMGDILSLKDALLCIAEVGSTDVGYGMLLSVPGLQRRFIAISRFASTISVRCIGLIGGAILVRSKRGVDDMAKNGYSVLLNPNAYVSAEGIPYSVSFAHMRPSKSMSISRKVLATNTTARFAHGSSLKLPASHEVPRRVWDHLHALSNPVSREGSKKILYKIMKRRPALFMAPPVQMTCLECAFTYRMRHTERKFIADLLDAAQVATMSSSGAPGVTTILRPG